MPVSPNYFFTHDFPIRGVVFDIDGVLIDSKDSNIAFYNEIRKSLSLAPLNIEEEKYCHMASSVEVLQQIVPQEQFDEAMEIAKTINYNTKILPLIIPHAGAVEALYFLKYHNFKLGVFTNRRQNVTDLLYCFGFENFFDPIKTALIVKPKPDPQGLLEILDEWKIAPQELVFVGDTEVDCLAARAARVRFWAFGNSFLSADVHLSSFQDFVENILSATV